MSRFSQTLIRACAAFLEATSCNQDFLVLVGLVGHGRLFLVPLGVWLLTTLTGARLIFLRMYLVTATHIVSRFTIWLVLKTPISLTSWNIRQEVVAHDSTVCRDEKAGVDS